MVPLLNHGVVAMAVPMTIAILNLRFVPIFRFFSFFFFFGFMSMIFARRTLDFVERAGFACDFRVSDESSDFDK